MYNLDEGSCLLYRKNDRTTIRGSLLLSSLPTNKNAGSPFTLVLVLANALSIAEKGEEPSIIPQTFFSLEIIFLLIQSSAISFEVKMYASIYLSASFCK